MTQEITRHVFKRHEWLGVKSRRSLVKILKQYQKEVGISEWCISDVEYFLQLFHHLYRGKGAMWHHVRCIVTIIADGELQ